MKLRQITYCCSRSSSEVAFYLHYDIKLRTFCLLFPLPGNALSSELLRLGILYHSDVKYYLLKETVFGGMNTWRTVGAWMPSSPLRAPCCHPCSSRLRCLPNPTTVSPAAWYRRQPWPGAVHPQPGILVWETGCSEVEGRWQGHNPRARSSASWGWTRDEAGGGRAARLLLLPPHPPKKRKKGRGGGREEGKKEGLPWWRSGWESPCQCRGHGFKPWSGKIPRAAEQLGPWATTTEPARLEPVLHNKRGRDSERPVHSDEEWSPLAATRESPPTETKTQHSSK